jgi:glutamate carboxypeptidase
MLDMAKLLVEHESPSREKFALDGLADTLTRIMQASGASVERVKNQRAGDHLRALWRPQVVNRLRPALVLCHFDTVWPIGTLSRIPWRLQGESASGPGLYDMKASLVIVAFALRAISECGASLPRPVKALLTSDEEVGSPTSRQLIETEANGSAYVLVMEPPLPDGSLKTARKGVGAYTITVEGRAAHAGVEPEKGANAIVELAHQIVRIQALANRGTGTSLNVGLIEGGSTVNTVPARAHAQVDARATTLEEAGRIDASLRELRPIEGDCSLTIEGGWNRPPMERTPASTALFKQAQAIGAGLDTKVGEGSTGGGSDGNFTAALGVPTLDGLGCQGGGAHATNEHILCQSLVDRVVFLAELLLKLHAD